MPERHRKILKLEQLIFHQCSLQTSEITALHMRVLISGFLSLVTLSSEKEIAPILVLIISYVPGNTPPDSSTDSASDRFYQWLCDQPTGACSDDRTFHVRAMAVKVKKHRRDHPPVLKEAWQNGDAMRVTD
jgi:hypothetical protein